MDATLRRMQVALDATVLDAMRAINAGGHAIACVTDSQGRVVGTLTDGDLRRALIAGASLESRALRKAVHRGFAWVGAGAGRAEVLDMMRARGIAQVPVLDARRRLVGLHLLHDLLGARERPNAAVIMAGGKGERLRPLTLTVPKPMIPVAGRPILERLVLHLVGAGIRRIYISVNYLGHIIERHFRDGRGFGCRISYLHESKPLGTGGALSLLPRQRHPVLTLNGDLVTQVDIGAMLDFHQAGGFTATIGTRSHEATVPFGVVDVRGKRVVRIEEKPSEQLLINAGIYVLSPRAVRLVPRRTGYLITELVQTCLKKRHPVGAYYIADDWQDVGRPDELRRARGEL